MAYEEDELEPPDAVGEAEVESVRSRLPWRMTLQALLAILVALLAIAWFARVQIVDNILGSELEKLGVPASYEIESIGARRQVLSHVVIGDPYHPDLTIDRVETSIRAGLDGAGLAQVKLVRPRLYGHYRNGKLSFGSLDPLIFTGGKGPFRLPDLDLAIVDGRGLLETDYGPVGVEVEGSGGLRDGFAGELAAIAPHAAIGGCTADRVSLYGKLAVGRERPRFTGPMRIAALACQDRGISLAKAGMKVEARFDPALDGVDGRFDLETGALAVPGARSDSLGGHSRFTFRKGALTARYDIAARNLRTGQLAAGSLGFEGHVRGAEGFSRLDTEGTATGSGIELAGGLDAALAEVARASEGSFAAPMIEKIRAGLRREGRGSTLTAAYVARRNRSLLSLVVPQGTLRGGSGAALLSLSRLQLSAGEGKPLRVTGNFATGGTGMPQIAGRMERPAGGPLAMRVSMPEYSAGDGSLALPRLMIVQRPDGALGFAGEARLSGALPGGHAENLVVPLEGSWSGSSGLSLWRDCAELRFDRLEFASLALDHRQVTLCPPTGSAIVRSDAHGTRIAAGATGLDLAGHLGGTPIRIASGPVGFAWPGRLAAQSLDVALGPEDTASHFRVADLAANIAGEISGTFDGTDVKLNAVPLDVLGTSGKWHYANGVLTLSDGAFRLVDRQAEARFQPLVAKDATLTLADNRITAEAVLREPESGREVVRADIRHDLATGSGSADLKVAGLHFDKQLQPDTISRLALGVIANAEGTVRGTGRVDWTQSTLTSTGRFSTDSLDFAAAFGPVKGLSGTIVFTDLLGLVTAPDQYVLIPSMNPGIEVTDGRVEYELRPGLVLAVKGGKWPFLGGTLELLPTQMRLGVAEDRHYTLRIRGLDAAKLAAQMDLANIAVDGTFDGELPLLFDKDGGHIVNGVLQSRPPGGNFSYVGELTYKDLSTMANFAFDALKSLDYRSMRIELGGSLEGEIVTRVVFDGIRQGHGASRNFLTKQIARLPIRFKVNIRAPFFQLATSLKSYYDPAYVRDPRSLGLLDSHGRPMRPVTTPSPDAADRPRTIQPPESGKMP